MIYELITECHIRASLAVIVTSPGRECVLCVPELLAGIIWYVAGCVCAWYRYLCMCLFMHACM